MGSLLTIAEHFLIERLVSNSAPLTGQSKAIIVTMAFIILLLAVAAGFFMYAAYLWMGNNYPPETAAALTGLIALSVAVLIGSGIIIFSQYKKHRIKKFKMEVADTVQTVLALADDEVTQPIKDHPKTAVLIASLAGYIAGEKFI